MTAEWHCSVRQRQSVAPQDRLDIFTIQPYQQVNRVDVVRANSFYRHCQSIAHEPPNGIYVPAFGR